MRAIYGTVLSASHLICLNDPWQVTDYRLALKMGSHAVNGPTWHEAGLPPFRWSNWPHVAHKGMRDEYRTEWELQEP
jgi:hypothetical protein